MNVQGPDGKVIQFPDDMPTDQVNMALQKHYAQQQPGQDWKAGLAPSAERQLELRQAPSKLVSGAEDVARGASFIPGEVAGGLVGAASPVPGGAALSAAAGAGLTATAADAVIAYINNKMYGTPIDMSKEAVARDVLTNMGASAVGQAGGALLGKVAAGVGPTLRGEAGVAGAAKQAAEKAETAAAGAAEKAGQARLKAGTESYEKASTAQDVFTTKMADTTREAAEQAKEIEPQVVKELTPEARQATFEKTAGKTQAEAVAGRTTEPTGELPMGASAEQRTETWRNLTQPVTRWRDAWAAKRDKLLEPYMDTPADTSGIQQSIADEQQFAQQRNYTFSSQVRGLFGKVAEKVSPGVEAKIGGVSPAEMAKINPNMLTMIQQKLGAESAPVTVRDLIGLRTEASRVAELPSLSPSDHTAASAIVNSIDDSLAKLDVPSLKPLNEQYRFHKDLFDRDYFRTVGHETDRTAVGKELFASPQGPQRPVQLWAQSSPEERATMRELYGDWILNTDLKNIKPEHAAFLSKMYPNTPFATPEGVNRMVHGELTVSELLDSSPAVEQKFQEGMRAKVKDVAEKAATQVVKDGVQAAQKMGPMGQKMLRDVRAAKDVWQQERIVTQFMTGMSADDVAKTVMQRMATPEAAGRTAIARQWPDMPVAPTTPNQAAMASIMSGKTLPGRGGLDWINRRLPLYLSIAGVASAMGKMPSYWQLGLLTAGGAMKASQMLKQAFIKKMADPARAAAFWNDVQNSAGPGAIRRLGEQAADSAISTLTAKFGKKMQGGTLEPEQKAQPQQTSSAPMELFYRQQAEQSFGGKHINEESVDTLAKVHKDLDKGKVVDVDQDIKSGKLSIPALKQTLTKVTQQNVSNMLQYMGPDDAMHMLQVASPEDKQWLVPAVKDKLTKVLQYPKLAPQVRSQAQQFLAQIDQQ